MVSPTPTHIASQQAPVPVVGQGLYCETDLEYTGKYFSDLPMPTDVFSLTTIKISSCKNFAFAGAIQLRIADLTTSKGINM